VNAPKGILAMYAVRDHTMLPASRQLLNAPRTTPASQLAGIGLLDLPTPKG